MKLPNFLGIGAMRSGTTWLYNVLKSHPDIYVPSNRKEVCFFDQYYDRGLEWYEKFFPSGSKSYTAIGEISPTYLADIKAPSNIKHDLSNCRFIVILRNPVDRVYSQYQYVKMKWDEKGDIWDVMKSRPMIYERGLYYRQLKHWFKYFPKERFLILIFEDVMADPKIALKKIADFLSVDTKLFDMKVVKKRSNPSRKPRFPRLNSYIFTFREFMQKHDLDLLAEILKKLGVYRIIQKEEKFPPMKMSDRKKMYLKYKKDIDKLEGLIKQDLSVWRISK